MPRGLLGGEPEGVDEQDAQGLDRFVAFEASLSEEDQGFLPEPDWSAPAFVESRSWTLMLLS
jgi:hypothetical protein